MKINEIATLLVEAVQPKAPIKPTPVKGKAAAKSTSDTVSKKTVPTKQPKHAKIELVKPEVKKTRSGPISKEEVLGKLAEVGYEDNKVSGNVIRVLVQIPSGKKKNQYRMEILGDILNNMRKSFPKTTPTHLNDPRLGSIGGIVFKDSPVAIVVKDVGKQGDQSAGVANEIELAEMLRSVIQKYGSATVSFVDEKGRSLSMTDVTEVETAGRDTMGGKKADVVLRNKTERLPISIKKLNADMWESADGSFGARAKQVIQKLVKDKVVKLNKIATRQTRSGESVPVYELSREIVMKPTPEEALKAIFGSDLNPEGGVVIQTFKPEHYSQKNNNVEVKCHAVIRGVDDIPDTHVMVWLLRNDSNRNSASLGIPGIRPLGVTLSRGIGRKGTKDVILVDENGKVIKNINA